MNRPYAAKQISVRNPFLQSHSETPAVKGFHIIGDDERHYAVSEAFLEHDEPAHAPVAASGGMDPLEPNVKTYSISYRVPLGRARDPIPSGHDTFMRNNGCIRQYIAIAFAESFAIEDSGQ